MPHLPAAADRAALFFAVAEITRGQWI